MTTATTSTVRQGIPCAVVALMIGANPISSSHVLVPSNAASLEWKIEQRLPMQFFDAFETTSSRLQLESSGLALSALAKSVFADSRPMAASEKEDADEFFRSHFA
jgi:hypothetical protein